MRAATSLCLVLVVVPALAEQGVLVLHVKDIHDKPVADVRIRAGANSSISPPTQPVRGSKPGAGVPGFDSDSFGQARIQLAPGTKVGDSVMLEIVAAPRDLVFISPWDSWAAVPPFDDKPSSFVTVVLADRSDRAMLENGDAIKSLVSQINRVTAANAPVLPAGAQGSIDPLAEVAKKYGLKPDDVDVAIRGWGQRTLDPYERALAELYSSQYPAAERDFSESLRQAEQEETQALAKVADRAAFLGQTFYAQGKYSEAAAAYKKATERKPDDSELLFRLAAALADNDQFPKAAEIGQRALQQSEAQLGKDNPSLAFTYFDIGSLYVNHKRYPEGEKYFSLAVELLDRTMGPKRPELLRFLNNLAMLYMVENKRSEAEPLLDRALEIQSAVLDPKDPEVTYTQNTLAMLYSTDGRYDDAEKLLTKSFNLLQDLVFNTKDVNKPAGNLPILMLQTMSYLVNVYELREKYNTTCEELLKRSVKIGERLT